jgi:biotin carboxylase
VKKTVVVIELPGGNDTDLLNALIEKDDSFIFVTADVAHYQSQPEVWNVVSQAKHVIASEGFDVDHITSELKKFDSIDGMLCLVDIRIIEAAEIAESFSLPFLNVDTALMLRDKATVRLQLDNLGLPQPKFKLALSNEDLARAVSEVGLPCIIKPSDGYGSQNIVYLESESDLEPWISPIQDMLPSGAHYGLGVNANDRLLVEEFMPGQVIGCDTLTVNGEHYLLGVNEKRFFAPPSFAIEGGSFTPNEGQFQEIEAYVFDILNGVYFNHGAAHVELKITSNGLRLIEVNPRLVGAKIPRLISYAIGASIYNMLIDLHTGEPVMMPERPTGVATSRWITANRSGVFASVSFPAECPEQIKCVEILKKEGDHVRPPFENADRIGYVMTCDPDRNHAERIAQNFVNSTKLQLTQHH